MKDEKELQFRITVISEQTATLAALEKELKNLSDQRKELNKAVKAGTPLNEAEAKELAEIKIETANLNAQRREALKIIDLQNKAINSQVNSSNEIAAKLNLLRREYDKLGEAERKTALGMGLAEKITELDIAIKELDAGTGRFQRNVGNYALAIQQAGQNGDMLTQVLRQMKTELAGLDQSTPAFTKLNNNINQVEASIAKLNGNVNRQTRQFNGLANSINQISREMPAFAFSVQTGFLALTNNIPILTDEINRLKVKNLELAASGQPTESVFKQIVSAVFSWQTAMSLAIAVITIWGPKIWEFFTGSSDAAKKAEEANKKYTESLVQATKSANDAATKDITMLDIWVKTAQSAEVTMNNRIDAVKKLQETYPETFGLLSQNTIMEGDLAAAIEVTTNQLFARAKAQAAIDKGVLAEQKLNDLKDLKAEIENEYKEILKSQIGTGEGFKSQTKTSADILTSAAFSNEGIYNRLIDINQRIAETSSQAIKYRTEVISALKTDLPTTKGDTDASKKAQDAAKKAADDRLKLAEQTAKELLSLIRANNEAEIALITDNVQRQKAIEDERYNQQTADLIAQKGTNLEINRQIDKALELAELQHKRNLATIDKNHDADMLKLKEAGIAKQAELSKKEYDQSVTFLEAEFNQQKITARNTITDKEDLSAELQRIEVAEIDAKIQAQKDYGLDSTELERKRLELIAKYNLDATKEQEKLDADAAKKRKDDIKAIGEITIQAAKNTVNAISQIKQQAIQRDTKRQIDSIKDAADTELSILKNQLDKGAITEAQFAKKKDDLDKKTKAQELQAQKLAFEEKKKLDIRSAIINGALAITATFARYGFTPVGIAAAVAQGLATGIQVAEIRAQEFANSGLVQPEELSSGKIKVNPNIPTKSNGDNVLATVKVGEVILNEQHQAMLGGDETFRRIGVPGFAGSGLAALSKIGRAPVLNTTPPVPVSFLRQDTGNFITKDEMGELLDRQAERLANTINSKKVGVLESDIRKATTNIDVYESESTF